MHRLAVVSDSHGEYFALEDFAKKVYKKAEIVCHLGDTVSDAISLQKMLGGIPFYSVSGNCDCTFSNTERIIEFGGIKILLCHGHTYHVKLGIELLSAAAKEKQVQLALYGHTHKSLERYMNGVFCINPGALRNGQYAYVDIDDDGIPYATFETL